MLSKKLASIGDAIFRAHFVPFELKHIKDLDVVKNIPHLGQQSVVSTPTSAATYQSVSMESFLESEQVLPAQL